MTGDEERLIHEFIYCNFHSYFALLTYTCIEFYEILHFLETNGRFNWMNIHTHVITVILSN